MSTTENNKIIAEFMNLKDSQINKKGNGIEWVLQTKNFLYHSNWNWLIEVVEKVRIIYEESGANEDFRIKLLLFMRTQNTIYDLNIFSSKEVVYNACLEFIKWYNEQK